MDKCNWQIPKEYFREDVRCILPLQQILSKHRINMSTDDEYGMYLNFSWQKSVHKNNVEENTYIENQQLWKHIEEAFKDVSLDTELKTCVRPYSTEFSKNVFLCGSSDGECIRILQRIRNSFWNARFKRGESRYPFEIRGLLNDNEIRNGQKISFYTRDVQLSVYAKNLEIMSKRGEIDAWVLEQLNRQKLSVLRFEVRIITPEKLRSVIQRATGKLWLGDVTELLDPAIESAIIQYYFLPLIQQIPQNLPIEGRYAYWFESGLKQGVPLRALEQTIGYDVLSKEYPVGGLQKVVVNPSLSKEGRTTQRSAWQYNRNIVKQTLEAVPFVEGSKWPTQKEEIIKQLVEFQPFHFSDCGYLPEEKTIEQKVINC